VIGPNCLGIMMMPGVALNASFSVHMPGPGNLALISQSGAIAAGALMASYCTIKSWDERYFAGKPSDGVMVLWAYRSRGGDLLLDRPLVVLGPCPLVSA
jgi:hypothetical protein